MTFAQCVPFINYLLTSAVTWPSCRKSLFKVMTPRILYTALLMAIGVCRPQCKVIMVVRILLLRKHNPLILSPVRGRGRKISTRSVSLAGRSNLIKSQNSESLFVLLKTPGTERTPKSNWWDVVTACKGPVTWHAKWKEGRLDSRSGHGFNAKPA